MNDYAPIRVPDQPHTLAWLPVGLLGVTNALLFKKTGRLADAVILHMVYNAVVIWA